MLFRSRGQHLLRSVDSAGSRADVCAVQQISRRSMEHRRLERHAGRGAEGASGLAGRISDAERWAAAKSEGIRSRSEEHTSELQSLMRISYAVFCLKKKKSK